MDRSDHYRRLEEAFSALLDDLARSWPAVDLAYVSEEVGYQEFGEALDELIATGLKNGMGFTSDQMAQIEALAEAMGPDEIPYLSQARARPRRIE